MPTFSFVQISDSHLGFARDPNKDVAATLKQTVARINAMPVPPAFVLHTGDITHLAKPDQFDTVAEILKEVKTGTGKVFYVPGEHDFEVDGNQEYLKRYGRNTRGSGWYSFDYGGTHFIGLVNVASSKTGSGEGGLGVIGKDQLKWLRDDVARFSESTPMVVFAHVPLWMVYEKWGWGTRDSEQALEILKRFGSLTVLNGHIHQVLQKVEGNVTFHSARSTAFPQNNPGHGTPGPMRDLAADMLKRNLGLTTVSYIQKNSSLAIVDSTLE
jgi:3',5'-cyclic AMP phosphodiesterase CpdA